MQVSDEVVVMKYIQLRDRCRTKGLEFGMTLTGIKNLLRAKRCYYTGTEFGEGETYRTIDRIDSSKGYVTGNVVACISRVNRMKSNMTAAEIMKLSNKLNKGNKK